MQKSESPVEVEDPNQVQPPQNESAPPVAGQPVPVAAPAPADAPGKIVQLKTHQIGQLKREAGAAAQRKLAAEMGFGSVDEMKAAAARMKNAPKAQPAPQRQAQPQKTAAAPQAQARPAAENPDLLAMQRELSDLRAKNEKLAREKARAERTARERQRQSLASQAESELRSIAAAEGITDLEYAIHLIRQHTNGMDEAKLRAFDERAYFRGLRPKYPYLFNQVTQPANSGLPENPGANRSGSSVQTAPGELRQQPPTPAPRQPGARVDTSKMSPREFQDYLRSKGISVN